MTIRNQPIRNINASQGSSSFYPSQFASFCEMGRISDIIFNNRLSNQNNNNINDRQDEIISKCKTDRKDLAKNSLYNDSPNKPNPNSSDNYNNNDSINYVYN